MMGLGLHYHRGEEDRLTSRVNASFGGKKGIRRSTTRCVFTLIGAAIHYSSQVQRKMTLSTIEAEYVRMCRGAQETICLRHLLRTLSPEADRVHYDV